MYLPDGDRFVIFASKGGSPTNPDWYHNLLSRPEASIEVGTEMVAVRAVVAEGAQRDTLFDRQASLYPAFRGYQEGTDRTIPVVILEPLHS